ncbi:hypothetical protein [Rheinheimera maricola]|uniref:Uncharacterized protein n=1 Tax=Rheinheimera maricola TaxID=2793282 RepID=A0ABS7X927_9GAMM|nr:hypothetical protein [Rheinheimera maricola]MBZ9612048.1 hypothetical protein [Rheinheimera maricola]
MIIDTLPPKIAAALAADVYDTLDMPAGAVFTPKDKALSKLFDFSSQGGLYMAAVAVSCFVESLGLL